MRRAQHILIITLLGSIAVVLLMNQTRLGVQIPSKDGEQQEVPMKFWSLLSCGLMKPNTTYPREM